MISTRRNLILGAGAGLALAGCDTPSRPGARDVLAAGQPAALLIWALARDRLLGWPRKPGADALRALAPGAAALPQLGALTTGGAPSSLEALAALHPRLILDYGDVGDEHQALADRLKGRLGVEWRLIDGALTRTPQAIRQAGALLGVPDKAEALAGRATAILADWGARRDGPSFYYARGGDGLETAFHGALATEVLEGAGWTNVAVGARDIGRVSREQVVAWNPHTLVTLDARFARAIQHDPVWRRRPDGATRPLLLIPDSPFGWIDRPPSVNRLLGCAWLADPEGSILGLAELTRALYGMSATETARPRWIA